MPVNSEKLIDLLDPNADVKKYTSKIFGINNGGKADVVADLTPKKYESTVVKLREYNIKYGLCSENTLANQWYLDTKVDIQDTNMRAQMEAVLTNDRLSQNQKIESQYDILKRKLTDANATPEDKLKWEAIAKDKKEIDEKYSTKKVAPKDGTVSEKIVKTCKMPAGFDNCVGRDAGEDIFFHTDEMYNKINEKNNTKINFAFITEQENAVTPPSTTGYIPWGKEAKNNKSGVTVGTGFDLGQRNENDLKKYKFPKETEDKLRPYLGLTKQEACNKLALTPMVPLTQKEVIAIDSATYSAVTQQTESRWNTLNPKTKFGDLSPERQTVLVSRSFQYGSGWIKPTNEFIEAGIQDDWLLAQDKYETSGSYGGRRKAEKKLLENAVDNEKEAKKNANK